MLSAFWKEAFKKFFDGSGSLVPAAHPNVDMNVLHILGTVLSHGYIACRFLPIHISFPVVAAILLGPNAVQLSDSMLCKFFVRYLNYHDSSILKEAFDESLEKKSFSQKVSSSVLSLLSSFGCRMVPSPANLKTLVTSVARHEFVVKPLGALYAMNGGIPVEHKAFWEKLTVKSLLHVYLQCTPTAASVLKSYRRTKSVKFCRRYFFQLSSTICWQHEKK